MAGHRKSRESLGLRERKKLETRARIRAAASELFTRHGYGAATMRQIARRAHVGLGTLFNYAEDKRDLVFLIFNEQLNALTDVALAAPRAGEPVLEQLLAVFRSHYDELGATPELSRILLQELTFYTTGKQAATFLGIRQRLIDGIEALLAAAQARKEISQREEAATLARLVFFVYSGAVRWWIAAPHPEPRKGLVELRRLLGVVLEGQKGRKR